MPTGVDRRVDPFTAAGSSDIGKPLARCCAHLLELVQHVCPCLFEKWAPLFSQLDRLSEVDRAWDVRHFTEYFQWRLFTAHWLKVKAERFGQRQLRYSQVILGSNELRQLIVICHFRLEHVEPRDCACFKTVLLGF